MGLTGHMFFSYPMGDFCVIKTWVQSILCPRTQLGDDLGVQKSKPRWVCAATWGTVVELTGHMFFSYPMGDFCVIETWVQSVLWPRTQLGDGPGGQKIITKVGPRCHLGSSGWTNRSHVLLLPHGGFLRH